MLSFPKAIVAVFLAVSAVCQTGTAVEQPWNLTETRLANGLTVVTHEDFSNPAVSVQVWYHVGSKDEPESRQGMAHLAEHLMFRGSGAVGDYQHGDLIHAVGGDNNAYYLDADDDSYGTDDVTTEAMSTPEGYDRDPGDCDDTDPAVNPRATEICDDGIDNNCDGNIDEEGCTPAP